MTSCSCVRCCQAHCHFILQQRFFCTVVAEFSIFLCYSFLCIVATKMLGRISNFFTKEQGLAFNFQYSWNNVLPIRPNPNNNFQYGFQNGSMICIVHVRDLVLVRKWVNRNKLKKEICLMSIVKKICVDFFLVLLKTWFFQKFMTHGKLASFMLILHKCVKMKPLIRLQINMDKRTNQKHVKISLTSFNST
jgi:hypothetical protein